MAAKRKRLRRAAAGLAVLLAACFCTQAAAEKVITLTFTGDCVIGSEERDRGQPVAFDSFAEKYGYDYFFANFRELFSADDCTVINLQGVFADSNDNAMKSRLTRFRGPEKFVGILQAGSVEMVSLSNNHSLDYAQKGLENTERVLEDAGIGWAREKEYRIADIGGIRIAFVSIDYGAYQRSRRKIVQMLREMRENGEIHATVFLIHEGREYLPIHLPRQEEYGEFAVQDAGADLVIMHQAHVVQGMRILQGRSIFYSLGNFVHGGDPLVQKIKNADTLYTLVVQARLYFTERGNYRGQQILLIPAYTSGTEPKNDYRPVRLTAEEAAPVIEAIQKDTDFALPSLRTDENGQAYILMDFLAEEEQGENPDGEPEAAPPRPDRKTR